MRTKLMTPKSIRRGTVDGIYSGIQKKGAHHIKLSADRSKQQSAQATHPLHSERIFAHLKKWQHYRGGSLSGPG